MGKNYRVTLQNPNTKLVGSTTVLAWSTTEAKEEALKRLEPMGFTSVLKISEFA
jgi:hypothetical protein